MLWGTHWASLYSPESTSHHIISHIQNTYYLVNLVDNDFVSGNVLFQLVNKVLDGMSKASSPTTEAAQNSLLSSSSLNVFLLRVRTLFTNLAAGRPRPLRSCSSPDSFQGPLSSDEVDN
jgi:hypothetical protein